MICLDFELFCDVITSLIYFKIRVNKDKDDREYQKEIMKFLINSDKLSNGVYSHPLVKGIMQNFFKSINFDFKIPFTKVGKVFIISIFTKPLQLQGHYHITNLTIAEHFFPEFLFKDKFMADLRFVGKVKGVKAPVFLSNYIFYCEIKK